MIHSSSSTITNRSNLGPSHLAFEHFWPYRLTTVFIKLMKYTAITYECWNFGNSSLNHTIRFIVIIVSDTNVKSVERFDAPGRTIILLLDNKYSLAVVVFFPNFLRRFQIIFIVVCGSCDYQTTPSASVYSVHDIIQTAYGTYPATPFPHPVTLAAVPV